MSFQRYRFAVARPDARARRGKSRPFAGAFHGARASEARAALGGRESSVDRRVSKGALSGYLRRTAQASVTWELARDLDDAGVEVRLFRLVGRNEPPRRVAIDPSCGTADVKAPRSGRVQRGAIVEIEVGERHGASWTRRPRGPERRVALSRRQFHCLRLPSHSPLLRAEKSRP